MRRDLPPPHVTNERIKGLSGLLFNAGGGLAAAALVRLYTNVIFDVQVALWFFVAAALIFIAWQALALLEPEV